MNRIFRATSTASLLVAAFLMMGCGKAEKPLPEWPWADPEPETEQPEKPEEKPDQPEEKPDQPAERTEWTDVTSEFGKLPEHIKIWKSPDKLEGKKANAYIADADMSKAHLDLWSIDVPNYQGTTEKLMTPGEVYNKDKSAVVINAGFFYSSDGKNYSSSLALEDSKYLAYNINYASQDWVVMYYPTRAAFIKDKDGKYTAWWNYYNGNDKKHYFYASPAKNNWDSDPLAVPSATFPVNAEKLEPVWGIGGGPLLLKEGKIHDTFVEELFNGKTGIGPDSDQPRTAVGVTAKNHILFFVCEGRNSKEGIKGLTTGDVAKVLKERGCIEAINLDGGGSTCMLVNGKETVKVSDGSQRRVGSTLMLK